MSTRRFLAGIALLAVLTPIFAAEDLPDNSSEPATLPKVRVTAETPEQAGYVAERTTTATKTDAPLLEVPQSVSVVTLEQIDIQNAQTVAQALNYSAGIVPGPRQEQDAYDSIYCRGFSGNGFDEYLDGMRQLDGSFGVLRYEPYFLQSIEVLKGPASVLYGQAAPGCITNLTSKRPSADAVHEIGVQYGSYHFREATLDVGGSLTDGGVVTYRLTGFARDTDDQVDFVERERYSVAPALTWNISPDTTLTLLTSFQHDPKGELPGYVPASGTVLYNPNGTVSPHFFSSDPNFNSVTRTQTALAYLFEHRFGQNWTLRQNFRYTDVDQDQSYLYLLGLEPDQRTLDRYSYHDIENAHGFTVDTQVQGRFSTGPFAHTVLVGVDYQRLNADQVTEFGFDVPSIDMFAPVYYLSIAEPEVGYSVLSKSHQTGLYAQDSLKLNRWTLLVGGREDWSNISQEDRLYGGGANQDTDKFTGRAGLVYLFDSGLAPYASYATSFDPQIGTTFDGTPYKPTEGSQYEAGLKYQPPGYNAFITLAAYNLTQRNELTTDPLHPDFSIQVGESRARGVEFEAHASPLIGLNLIGAYTYTDAKVTESDDTGTTIDGLEVPLQGQRLVLIPRSAASLWADYTLGTGPLRGLLIGGGVRYVGPTPGDNVGSLEVPSYTVFDAVVRYEVATTHFAPGAWRFTLNANNVFNKEYISSCYSANFCNFGGLRALTARADYRW